MLRWRCGCCPVADGSDHGGSLRNPAAFNNLFALRPTYGRVPNADEDAFIPGFSVIGPMARNIPDLQMLLAVQSGYDARQPYSIPEPHSLATPPLDFDPKGKRIAWIGDFGGHIPFEAGVLELCRKRAAHAGRPRLRRRGRHAGFRSRKRSSRTGRRCARG